MCRLDVGPCRLLHGGELPAQGAGLAVCRLGGLLGLLGELHGGGTATLSLTPCHVRCCGTLLGLLVGLALVAQLAPNLGELSAQGAGLAVCRLGGLLGLLGELHGGGTATLSLTPCHVRCCGTLLGLLVGLALVAQLAPNLGELSAQGAGLAVCRLGGLLGLLGELHGGGTATLSLTPCQLLGGELRA
ncbi:hypothetical protein STIB_73170 [Streptomyces sp. IB2014 011-1]|nr:hypothetical protein STIB_73170 [Streptomyces sp. IB2014 011-1]